jgi:cyclopropane fatty-acyl-phospholipid synthase-like methyltransferase
MINQSPACERNKEVIAEQLLQAFAPCKRVLEVGSGSGQHILHFAKQMPAINWQPMDFGDYIEGLQYNLQNCADNILEPLTLVLDNVPWVIDVQFDGLFSANTLHIMSWHHVIGFFDRAGKQLSAGGILCIYGPFKYKGEFTSPSNVGFEQWLKQRDPLSGVRDFEAICQLASKNGLSFISDQPMPANNQFLTFIKN